MISPAFRPYRPGDVPEDAVVGRLRVTLEADPTGVPAVLEDADGRDEFSDRAELVNRMTFPAALAAETRELLASWWGPTMSAQLLRALVDKCEWRLISDAVEGHPLDVLQVLALPFSFADDEEPGDKAPEVAPARTVRAGAAVEMEDEPVDDGSNDPGPIDEAVVEAVLANLTAQASGALATALVTEAFAADSTPVLAEHLADAGQLAQQDLARLAAGVIAADQATDLARWSAPAAQCDDPSLLAMVLERLVGRLVPGTATDEVEAVLNLCVELAFRVGDEAIFTTVNPQLSAASWIEDPRGRVELGAATVRHLAPLDGERAADLAYTETVAAIHQLTDGNLRPGDALSLQEFLDANAQTAIDDILASEAAGVSRARRMEARLWLRRHSSQKLARIRPSAVGRLMSGIDPDDKVALAARDQLAHEFFAKPPTERKVSTFVTTGRVAFRNDLAAWMKATTPVPATNIWLQVATANYPDATLRVMSSARPLEPRRLAEFLGELAASEDRDHRMRALTLLRMFPYNRPDIGLAVQAVAPAIYKRSPEETKSAVRILVDYAPRPLNDDAEAVIRNAPGYAFIRKADRAFRKRLGG